MKTEPIKCDKSPTGRHVPTYVDGKLQFTDSARLRATCQHCGQGVRRVHRHSAWWRLPMPTEGQQS